MTMNENTPAPSSLNPGLDMQPRRRRGQRATAVVTRPGDAAPGVPTAFEQVDNESALQPQAEKMVSEADVAAASKLAQAVLKAGLMADFPARNVGVSKTSPSDERATEQGPKYSTAEVVDDPGSTQLCTPPIEPRSPSPLPSTFSQGIHGAGKGPDSYHRGTDNENSSPDTVMRSPPGQTRAEADDKEPRFPNEWPEATEAAGADTIAEVDSPGD